MEALNPNILQAGGCAVTSLSPTSLFQSGCPNMAEEYIVKLLAFPVLCLAVITGSFILQYIPRPAAVSEGHRIDKLVEQD